MRMGLLTLTDMILFLIISMPALTVCKPKGPPQLCTGCIDPIFADKNSLYTQQMSQTFLQAVGTDWNMSCSEGKAIVIECETNCIHMVLSQKYPTLNEPSDYHLFDCETSSLPREELSGPNATHNESQRKIRMEASSLHLMVNVFPGFPYSYDAIQHYYNILHEKVKKDLAIVEESFYLIICVAVCVFLVFCIACFPDCKEEEEEERSTELLLDHASQNKFNSELREKLLQLEMEEKEKLQLV